MLCKVDRSWSAAWTRYGPSVVLAWFVFTLYLLPSNIYFVSGKKNKVVKSRTEKHFIQNKPIYLGYFMLISRIGLGYFMLISRIGDYLLNNFIIDPCGVMQVIGNISISACNLHLCYKQRIIIYVYNISDKSGGESLNNLKV